MRRKLSLAVTALGGALLLSGCGSTLGDARAAFGYSGLIAGDPSLSNYEQAKDDFAAARYGLAVKRFRRAMADDPASVEAVNGLAAAYDQLGRYDLAERYYRRALAMDPTSVQTLNNLGYSLLLQGKPELALAFFRDAARMAPDNMVIATNAEQAVTARIEARSQEAAAFLAEPAAPAAAPDEPTGPRIVRLNAGEQVLLMPQPRPPAMPAVPLLPVEARALPAPAELILEPTPVALRPTVHIAAETAAQNAVVPAGPAEMPVAAIDVSASIELANGNGRRHMAARMQAYLAQLGILSTRLSNADRFSYATTSITYRPGHRGLAEALSAALPIAPRLQQVKEQAADVRVQLGGDLLEFDLGLLQAERNGSHADAV